MLNMQSKEDLEVAVSDKIISWLSPTEECELQAGTLGLVQILLDLLQIKNLELSQVQVFMLTLAHVLESSSKFAYAVEHNNTSDSMLYQKLSTTKTNLFLLLVFIHTWITSPQPIMSSCPLPSHEVPWVFPSSSAPD